MEKTLEHLKSDYVNLCALVGEINRKHVGLPKLYEKLNTIEAEIIKRDELNGAKSGAEPDKGAALSPSALP